MGIHAKALAYAIKRQQTLRAVEAAAAGKKCGRGRWALLLQQRTQNASLCVCVMPAGTSTVLSTPCAKGHGKSSFSTYSYPKRELVSWSKPHEPSHVVECLVPFLRLPLFQCQLHHFAAVPPSNQRESSSLEVSPATKLCAEWMTRCRARLTQKKLLMTFPWGKNSGQSWKVSKHRPIRGLG